MEKQETGEFQVRWIPVIATLENLAETFLEDTAREAGEPGQKLVKDYSSDIPKERVGEFKRIVREIVAYINNPNKKDGPSYRGLYNVSLINMANSLIENGLLLFKK